MRIQARSIKLCKYFTTANCVFTYSTFPQQIENCSWKRMKCFFSVLFIFFFGGGGCFIFLWLSLNEVSLNVLTGINNPLEVWILIPLDKSYLTDVSRPGPHIQAVGNHNSCSEKPKLRCSPNPTASSMPGHRVGTYRSGIKCSRFLKSRGLMISVILQCPGIPRSGTQHPATGCTVV